MLMAPVYAGAVLHVGCGNESLPDWIGGSETRLDIDKNCNPDIHASMTDMGEIGPFDTIYCSHSLEHLAVHQVIQALGEFHRVLKDGGQAIVIVPDLEGISPTFAPVYDSPSGPISGFDMYFGEPELVRENPFMAHRCGFVRETLWQALDAAGFSSITVIRDHDGHNLFGMALK